MLCNIVLYYIYIDKDVYVVYYFKLGLLVLEFLGVKTIVSHTLKWT